MLSEESHPQSSKLSDTFGILIPPSLSEADKKAQKMRLCCVKPRGYNVNWAVAKPLGNSISSENTLILASVPGQEAMAVLQNLSLLPNV